MAADAARQQASSTPWRIAVAAVADDVARYFEDRHAVLSCRSSRGAGRNAKPGIGTPVLYWAADSLGAHFILAQGIVHVRQPEAGRCRGTGGRCRAIPGRLPHSCSLTTLTGSALLALALFPPRCSTRIQVLERGRRIVDEDWNSEQWGQDGESRGPPRPRVLVDFRGPRPQVLDAPASGAPVNERLRTLG